jgi:hypothetical protein
MLYKFSTNILHVSFRNKTKIFLSLYLRVLIWTMFIYVRTAFRPVIWPWNTLALEKVLWHPEQNKYEPIFG